MSSKEIIRSKDFIEAELMGSGVDPVDDEGRALVRTKVGLTYEELCKAVAEGMRAKTVLVEKGSGRVLESVANHSVRAKFAPLAAELIPGAKAPEQSASRFPNIIIIAADGRKI